jgi:chloramphenicol-sensitive protein RarD
VLSDLPPGDSQRGRGLLYALASYGLWGVLPGYFLLLAPSNPFEIVTFRILLSLAFCALLLVVVRGWRRFSALAANRRLVLLTGLASVFIYINWQVFVITTVTGHVVEGALGYFINPLVTVLLGVVILRERLRLAQWLALGVALVAILVIGFGYGSFPWLALVLAVSFGLYGFVKKVIGPEMDAVSGLTFETAWLAPVAVVQLIVVGATSGIQLGQHGNGQVIAMLFAGVVTTVPLLLFSAGARRLPLVAIGLAQFLAPALQFLFGVFVLREPMPPERWIGFGLVWVALIALTVDILVARRPPRRASLERV